MEPLDFGDDSLGRVFHGLFTKAFEHHQAGDRDESERICRLLLSYPALGDLHKAGVHLMLAHGQDCTVHHADQAVFLYQNLYKVRPGGSHDGSQPSEAALAYQKEFLDYALQHQKKVHQNERLIRQDYDRQMQRFRNAYNRDPTPAELLDKHFESHRATADAYWEKVDPILDTIWDDDHQQETSSAGDQGDDAASTSSIDTNIDMADFLPSPPTPPPASPSGDTAGQGGGDGDNAGPSTASSSGFGNSSAGDVAAGGAGNRDDANRYPRGAPLPTPPDSTATSAQGPGGSTQ